MCEEEFLEKALTAIQKWKEGEIDSPFFLLVRERESRLFECEIEVIHPLIVGKLISTTKDNKCVYRFDALVVKEILSNES
ncbi:hypothetical protein NIES4101_53240 [Calothrix sp. NIES-4101]|nr:hypothetical protein NIES4101_53240 [Calothrix sp. NIES-4101]